MPSPRAVHTIVVESIVHPLAVRRVQILVSHQRPSAIPPIGIVETFLETSTYESRLRGSSRYD